VSSVADIEKTWLRRVQYPVGVLRIIPQRRNIINRVLGIGFAKKRSVG
jgi:hypothetical protein